MTTHERIANAHTVVRNLEALLNNATDNASIMFLSHELDRADRRYRTLTAELLTEIEVPGRQSFASIGVSSS
jgi:hypothetical protein